MEFFKWKEVSPSVSAEGDADKGDAAADVSSTESSSTDEEEELIECEGIAGSSRPDFS